MSDIPAEIRICVLLDTIQTQRIMTKKNLLHAYTIMPRWMRVLVGKKSKKFTY
jgi:hypothetical protein